MTPIIDREIFFGNPEIIESQLSPDGKYMAFIKPFNGVRNIWIKKTFEDFDQARPITADTARPIPAYFWSRDSKYILYVQDKGGNENFHVYALDPFSESDNASIPEARNLTPTEGVRSIIYHVARKDPNILFIGLNDRDNSWHDLYQIHIPSGTRQLIKTNDQQIGSWIFDLEDQLRLANRSTSDGGMELLSIEGDEFKPIYQTTVEESHEVIRFHKNKTQFYLATNRGEKRDLAQLVLFNLETLSESLVESDPEGEVDFGNAIFSEYTDELLATTYEGDKPRIYFKDESFKEDYQLIKELLPDVEISFGSSTKDESMWMVHATSDIDPGATYLYDKQTKDLIFQYRPRPRLPIEHLAKMEPIRYASFDGLDIPAYLTIPKDVTPKNLPAIMLVHGGPWARDYWGYHSLAQFLANRGYVVLQPNFRGSTGYGKRFLNAGNGEWGQKMQDDVSAGVRFLIEKGLVDANRVGVMGGSYGGYATLAGLTFTPELYAAGVSIVGPSNLLTLLDSIPPYWETIRNLFYKRMADPNTEEGKALLMKQSPLFHAKNIRVPLLVVQGANDPRVKQAESDQIVYAMNELGLPVEYLIAPDEGHGFARPENNMAFFSTAEKFLAKHLGGRFQEELPEAIALVLSKITVNVNDVKVSVTVDEQSTHDFPEMGFELLPGMHTYRMTFKMGGELLPIKVVRTIEEKDNYWLVTDKCDSLMGNIEDQVLLKKDIMRPLQQEITQGPSVIQIKYSDSSVEGTMKVNSNIREFKVECDGPVVGSGVARNMMIQQLPLAENYTIQYPYFDPQVQKVDLFTIRVLGKEQMEYGGKSIEVFKLENVSSDGSLGKGIYWVTVGTEPIIIRSESVFPHLGGTEVLVELMDD